jgi:hypothetical protein
LDSGFPPLGGSTPPPSTLVSRRTNVLFPHPESAASPITTVLLPAAEHDTREAKKWPRRLLLRSRMDVPTGEYREVAAAPPPLACAVKASMDEPRRRRRQEAHQ